MHSILLLSVVIVALLTGCIGNRPVEAPVVNLTPAGWQSNNTLLQHDSFAAYQNAVADEVRRYRVPFDANRAEAEVALVSPVELPPGSNCEGNAIGIALLVHGLADTAFSLRDIGSVLSDACYRSRVILLPGHGTRAGDLLTTRLSDWQATIDYLVDQALTETDTLVLAGFSLGGVLTLDTALRRPDDIDGVIGISPAYYLSSARIARWAPWAAPLMRWVDKGVSDDPMRYEAMPTRGVAETWSAMQQLHKRIKTDGPVQTPWMLIQSMDDAVVVPAQNESLWRQQAISPHSRLVRFYSTQQVDDESRVTNLPGSSESSRVIALTHLAIHQSPNNPHYGLDGDYRNCGGTMPRDPERVSRCEQSDSVWYGLWDTEPAPGQALAFATFNPSFDAMADEIKAFVSRLGR